jgi:putative intracellular protease/amidase
MALLILYPGCIYHEVATTVYLFAEYEKVITAGPTSDPVATGEGLRLVPDITYDDARSTDEKTLLIPGGDCYDVFENEALLTLIRQYHDNRRWIGAICNGVLLAGKAGILEGRRVTHTAHEKWADPDEFAETLSAASEVFARTQYRDDDIILDGHIVSAKPWAHTDFATTMAFLAGHIDDQKKERIREYHRGTTPPPRA